MKLEDEIRQGVGFKSQYEKTIVNLMFTGSWLNIKLIHFYRNYNISPQQYNILRILRGQHPNPATINLLIERMLDKTSNASRLVDKLLIKGYVARKTSKTDKRQAAILITRKGLTLLEQIDAGLPDLFLQFNSLSEEEAQSLNHLLDKLRG